MQGIQPKTSRDLPRCGYLLLSFLTIILISCEGEAPYSTNHLEKEASPLIHESPPTSTWVVNPANPGPHIPPQGRSLFDFLISPPSGDNHQGPVPFPFTALLKHIGERLGTKKGEVPWRGVLIPYNRSLQRHASKPDYTRFPRAVVSVVAEPTVQQDAGGLLLKDRLFLGYQENSNVLEVISYNEAVGRFEFQIVTDYGPGLTARVQYANRTLCITCHQNQSPIFSKPLWQETNSNPEIARLLETHGQQRYGIPVHQSVDISQALDDSTHQANRFAIAQFLWKEGCEMQTSLRDSVQCRGNLLRLLLQYRLNGKRHLDTQPQVNGKMLLTTLTEGWNWKWPQGLRIPTPDIPNRNPFDFFQIGKEGVDSHVHSISLRGRPNTPVIRSIFEPSLPRNSYQVPLHTEDKATSHYLLNSLSAFLATIDIERLDNHLRRQWEQNSQPLRRVQTTCKGTARAQSGTYNRLIVECIESDSQPDKTPRPVSWKGVFYLHKDRLQKGVLEQLHFGNGQTLSGLEVTPISFNRTKHSMDLQFGVTQPHSAIVGRQANGMAIQNFQLHLTFPDHTVTRPTSNTVFKGHGTTSVIDDFSAVRRAITSLVEDTLSGNTDALGYKPFRRAVILESLFQQLGMPSFSWCCVDGHTLPPLNSTAHDHKNTIPTGDRQSLPPGLQLLQRYCADCHHEEEPFPPNFLHGSTQQVQAQVKNCSPRILTRLHMWNVAPTNRQEAPMPPFTALNRAQLSAESWRNHPDYKILLSYLTELVHAEMNGADIQTLLAQGYDHLPECLTPSRNTLGKSTAVVTS